MILREYFVKGKNYFLTIIIVTIIQAIISLFNVVSSMLVNPLGIVKLVIVGYASYNLRLKIKESLILGSLMFLCTAWFLFFALPVSIFMLDALSVTLIIISNALINTGIYILVSLIGCLISKKFSRKKK
jgi:hypothetical protein